MKLLNRTDTCVTVDVDGRELQLGLRWIRDHSQDPESLDPTTLQREINTFAIPTELQADNASVVDEGLRVAWTDGGTPSVVSESLLRSVFGLSAATDQQRWRSPAELRVDRHDCAAVMADDDALLGVIEDLGRTGVAVMAGMEPSEAAAEALAARVARVRSTVFGSTWRLSSEAVDFADSAYSQTYLEPHTDATYMTDAPGTQLFCCIERTGEGGESILVDGFALAEDLRAASPEQFRTLTETVVPGRYVEPGVHLEARRPTIRLDATGEIEQVSFNNYDRAPFWLPEPDMSAFYEAYASLHELIIDESRWLEIRLEPGDALIFDNWRVLHGRRAYTGRRVFHGCYHDRDDILSQRRVLGQLAGNQAGRADSKESMLVSWRRVRPMSSRPWRKR